MAKEGAPIIVVFGAMAVAITIGAVINPRPLFGVFTLIGWSLVFFSIYFFRDPERHVPTEPNIIVAPADGKIILLDQTTEPIFFGTRVYRISIFMSVFDVHVNRIPVEGRVTYLKYNKGKFLPAYQSAAAYENEQTLIGIENEKIKLLFKQIAGILAKRIVCNLRNGWTVQRGQRFGMIKFGSRIDLFLPLEVQLQVQLNQKVRAGETIIGRYE
ncbi:MAG: phosphatidylserine decarboxylase family protein [candidate division KSB1 bacterium]|nr:phosphatidylserine decarboxylase family protein [candidate division KSB1 bacterium]MDZ7335398.1 phosphatidylserine decarboxylase family protein [candidate division KSB1 bacterium]MDZ7356422.1 phosphatidylserine decarboxylase family protein [candidate division KSB1 bacterium]MDZ7376338.1 phosphatidylserine decarboxylase family protein [candidate division KSB1 bacterium]MDZ7401193.1 phosphatidylserine decarboxylase family protein [candidate division KSB1 bacterium]